MNYTIKDAEELKQIKLDSQSTPYNKINYNGIKCKWKEENKTCRKHRRDGVGGLLINKYACLGESETTEGKGTVFSAPFGSI